MKIYLSSTLDDLVPERDAVYAAFRGDREIHVVDSYTADERSMQESCLDDVAACDLYVGIIGRRYGFIPPGETKSITELEYEKALECQRPRLVFLKDDEEIKRNNDDSVTKENPPELIDGFRKSASGGGGDATRCTIFKTPQDLKSELLRAYLRYSQRHAAPKPRLIKGRPYPGLRSFLTEESDRFFGRDTEIATLVDRMLARAERFLAIIGPSGSGKSSLVYAGLIPVLTESQLIGGIHWLPVIISPRELGDDPFLPLANALSKKFPRCRWRVPELAQELRSDPAYIATIADEALKKFGTDTQLLLFVDQFEELFAVKVDSGARSAFFRMLVAAVDCSLLRVVIAMRSDFYSQWPQEDDAISLLRAGHFPVAPPGQAALKEMIVGPAEAAGLNISPQLVQRILEDTGTLPGALALTEFALSQLYDKRVGIKLTEDVYEAIDGVAGAIEGLAEDAVNAASKSLKAHGVELNDEVFSGLFLAIASVEQRNEEEHKALAVVRRRAVKSDLPNSVRILADALADKRILVSRGGSEDQTAVYVVGHEAVFSHWGRFREWYARYAEDLALRRQAEQAALAWDGEGSQQRWGWERQTVAIEALRKLSHLSQPASDPNFTDPAIATWGLLKPQLDNTPLGRFLFPEPLALLNELDSNDTSHQRREEIGLRLSQLGDSRRGVGLDVSGLPDIDWIDVPAGDVTLETATKDRFEIKKPFRLARYPVTWAQYRAFLDADDGYCDKQWWQGLRENKPGQLFWSYANYPAVNVSWCDAMAYCKWLSQKLDMDIRLPTEWQWQWAAVGNRRQKYPWPGNWNAAHANTRVGGIGRTVAVGLYPSGRSPFDVYDMAGNVWEWCLNVYDEPNYSLTEGDFGRVLRGGSWSSNADAARSALRTSGFLAGDRSSNIGFRVSCSAHID